LVYYCEIRQKWGKGSYTDECIRKVRMGMLWLKAGIWKLRGSRRGSVREKCPLCLGEEDAKHRLIKCPETKKWREKLCNKWLIINEDVAYRKILVFTCRNISKVKTIGSYLFKTKRKWVTEVGGNTTSPPQNGLRIEVIIVQ
jgi:hypothetical protein